MRTTPGNITELRTNEVFVFGSNLAGRHGAGAARQALKWGAVLGNGIGLHGQTYAFPTLDGNLQKLPLSHLAASVVQLRQCAEQNPSLTFLLTEVGCGLAGFGVDEIAPLFSPCTSTPNIHLPERFWAILRP